MLGKFTGEDESDANKWISQNNKLQKVKLTRSGSRVMRLWISCYMRQALMLQWRHVRRCLGNRLDEKTMNPTVRLTIDEGVENAHGAIRNTGIRMDLLENWKWYVSSLI